MSDIEIKNKEFKGQKAVEILEKIISVLSPIERVILSTILCSPDYEYLEIKVNELKIHSNGYGYFIGTITHRFFPDKLTFHFNTKNSLKSKLIIEEEDYVE